MIRWAGLLLMAGAALSACESAADIPGGRYNRSFVFEREDSALVEGVTPNAGARSIVMNGSFEAPTGCQNLSSQIDDDNRDLLVTISARSTGASCPAVLGYFRYTMITGSFFPGTYHLRVVHSDARGERTVFDGTVAVQF
jgi:hypothetical protein